MVIGSVTVDLHSYKVATCEGSWMDKPGFIHRYNSSVKGNADIYPDIEDFYRRNVNDVLAEDLVFEINGNRISCTLFSPEKVTVRGTIVAVSGDGDVSYRVSWRKDTLPFWKTIVEHFVESGFMVLLYDKPGEGLSEGDWVRQTIEDRAEELSLLMDKLMESDRLRGELFGLLGFSEGGLVAERVAINESRVSFVITLSTPSLTMKEIKIEEGLCILDRKGFSGFEKAIRSLFIITRFNAIRIISKFYRKREHIYYTIGYDPSYAIARLKVPLLAIFGEDDCIVSSKKNIARLRKLFCRGKDNGLLFVRVIDGADHLFRIANQDTLDSDRKEISTDLFQALSAEDFWKEVFSSSRKVR